MGAYFTPELPQRAYFAHELPPGGLFAPEITPPPRWPINYPRGSFDLNSLVTKVHLSSYQEYVGF